MMETHQMETDEMETDQTEEFNILQQSLVSDPNQDLAGTLIAFNPTFDNAGNTTFDIPGNPDMAKLFLDVCSSGLGSGNIPSGQLSLILAELKNTNFDSMESIPSATVQKFGGTDMTSLPHVNFTDLETLLQQQNVTQALPVITNDAILVTPSPDGNAYQTLENHPTSYAIDPNEEIHGAQFEQAPNYTETQQLPVQESAQNHNEPVAGSSDETMNSNSSDETNFKLPPACKLELTLSYSSLPVSGTISVDRPEGCILYYQKTLREFGEHCQKITFPSLHNTPIQKKFAKANPKAIELTERALTALQGGLQLLFRSDDGVYAIRRSRGKIYWTSTQQKMDEPNELPRNQEILVFNWKYFTHELSSLYLQKASSQLRKLPDLPAIYFTFAQKWCKGSSPVTSCLVWAKVVPKKAEEMVNGLFPKARPARVTSLNSGHLQISMSSH